MPIAFDALTKNEAFLNDVNFTHTPVGTPRVILVYIWADAQVTDVITGVTYGGVAMTRLPTHGFVTESAGETGVLYTYSLLASIPTGAQTVAIDTAGAINNGFAFCLSATAATTVQVAASNSTSGDIDDPSVTIATTSGYSGFVASCIMSGNPNTTDVSVGSGYTKFSPEIDIGNRVVTGEYGSKSGANVVANYTTPVADDVAMVAVALEEVAGGAAGRPQRRLLSASQRALTRRRM